MNPIDFDDDLILLPMGTGCSLELRDSFPLSVDPLDEEEEDHIRSPLPSDVSDLIDLSPMKSQSKKMSDIADLLNSSVLDDDEENDLPSLSTTIEDYLRTYRLHNDSNSREHCQWQSEENRLKFGKRSKANVSLALFDGF